MKVNRLVGVLLGVKAGALLGMLFAQRSGKELRQKLKDSDSPLKTLIDEGWAIDKEIFAEVSEGIKNSENLQKVLEMGKDQFSDFVEASKELGEQAQDSAVRHLEEIEKWASEASDEIKHCAKKEMKHAEKKAKRFGKDVKKKARKFENTLEDKIDDLKDKF